MWAVEWIQAKLQTKTAQNQDFTFTEQDVVEALEHLERLKNMQDCRKQLEILVRYLNNGDRERYAKAEELLSRSERIVSNSCLLASLYLSRLQQIVPANITFFHFMRERDIKLHYLVQRYLQLVAVRYCEGALSSLFEKASPSLLLLRWLSSLVDYRISALYIQSRETERLIRTTFFSLFSVLGALPSEPHFSSFAYVAIYMLSKGSAEEVLPLLDYYMRSMTCGIIDQYIPSQLFCAELGFVAQPYSHEILILLLCRILSRHYKHIKSLTALAHAWSVLHALLAEFSTQHRLVVEATIHLAQPSQQHPEEDLIAMIICEISATLGIDPLHTIRFKRNLKMTELLDQYLTTLRNNHTRILTALWNKC